MEALDALLDELNVLAKDLGTDASTNQKPPSQGSSPSGSTETADTGFDSSSENYNYSTVKRAPPKPPSGRNGSVLVTPQRTANQNAQPDLDLTNGLDEIMASLDKLESGSTSASSNEGLILRVLPPVVIKTFLIVHAVTDCDYTGITLTMINRK